LVEAAPRDPRFTVEWNTGSTLRVTVEAVDGDRFLNGEPIRLTLSSADEGGGKEPVDRPIPQTAPGRYELSVDSPTEPAFAAVRLGRRLIDQIALAGRYPPEFDAIGNDRAALSRLASLSGGRVIEPSERKPIDIQLPVRRRSLASISAIAGAVLIVSGLLRWRRGEIR
jgi:hypothetical protein